MRRFSTPTRLVLAFVAAAVLGCGSGGLGTTRVVTPVASAPATVASPQAALAPAASPTASAVAAPVLESGEPSAATTDQLARIETAVARMRGRALTQPVAKSFVTSAGMRALIDEELEDSEAIEDLRQEGLLLEALGLLPPGTDLLEAYRGLLGDQVLGLYNPEKRSLFVLANGELGPLELSTYAHEFHHALQDQRFNLERLSDATSENRDAGLALATLIEGDAVFTQSLYIAQELGQAGAMALLSAASAAPRPNAPAILVDMLQFPYGQGMAFVQNLAGGGGGVATIDSAFAQPPASTEQVLHLEKFRAREAPVAVAVAPQLPAGWSVAGEARGDVLGEYLLRRWLREIGLQPSSAQTAADGWGGDRFVVARAPDGSMGLVARVVWDTPADAEEFAAILVPGPPSPGIRLASAGRRWIGLVRVDPLTVLLVVAPNRASAEELARAAFE